MPAALAQPPLSLMVRSNCSFDFASSGVISPAPCCRLISLSTCCTLPGSPPCASTFLISLKSSPAARQLSAVLPTTCPVPRKNQRMAVMVT
jgi:hypothetical protein